MKPYELVIGTIYFVLCGFYVGLIITPPQYIDLTPVYHKFTIEQRIYNQAKVRGMKDEDIKRFIKIAYCESRFNPKATNINKNGTKDVGIFQINTYWYPNVSEECLLDEACNINEAISIANKKGFNQWICNKLIK